MPSQALWFGPSERPLFGRLFTPADHLARGGVLLCPPFDLEAQEVALAYRFLAEALQDRRFAVLHFDYDGMGDSAGHAGDHGRLEAWQHSVLEAADLLRSSGAGHISVIGIRFGATVASSVAGRGRADALVLWDPCDSGRSYLREQALLRRVYEAGQGLRPTASPAPGRPYARVETLGSVYGPETVAEMSALAIEELPVPLAPHVLALLRPGRPPRRGLIERLSKENIEFGTAAQQDELLSVWTDRAVVPEATTATIVAWLDHLAPSAVSPFQVAVRTATTLKGPGRQTVTERVGVSQNRRLFMITAEPAVRTSRRTIVLLNSGRTDHTGPGRLWVDLSRQWAALGLRVVRADLSGLGVSPARPGQEGDRAYPVEAVDDVRDIAQSVSPDAPSEVVLVGLCSGGYHSAISALEFPVCGVVAINPGLPPGTGGLAPEGGLALEDDVVTPVEPEPVAEASPRFSQWLRAKDGAKDWLRQRRPVYEALKKPADLAEEMKWWALNRTGGGARPAKLWKRLAGTGTSSLVIFCPKEGEVFLRGEHGSLRRLQNRRAFRVEVVEDSDHTLYLQRSRRAIVPILTNYVVSTCGCPSSAASEERAYIFPRALEAMLVE